MGLFRSFQCPFDKKGCHDSESFPSGLPHIIASLSDSPLQALNGLDRRNRASLPKGSLYENITNLIQIISKNTPNISETNPRINIQHANIGEVIIFKWKTISISSTQYDEISMIRKTKNHLVETKSNLWAMAAKIYYKHYMCLCL